MNKLQFSDQTIDVVIRGLEIIGDESAEEIIGSKYADHLDGAGNNDTLSGGAGNDRIEGGDGADTIRGGTGGDILYGESGDDFVDGGTGDDLIVGGDGAGNDRYVGGHGADTIKYASAKAGITVNLLNGRAQSKTVNDAAGIGVDNLSSIEHVIAGSYGDTLIGDDLANSLNGGDGKDTLIGGLGNDTLEGGSGSDTASYAGNVSAVRVNLALTNGQDTIGAGIDRLSSIEHLTGSSYNDQLTGNTFANIVNGGGGNDRLDGGGGNDRLLGGLGNDTLTGGANADRFVFNTAPNSSSNRDRITDFSVKDDTIELENAIFKALGAKTGTLAPAAFWKNTTGAAHDSSDRIIYNSNTGALFYDSNGNAAGGSVQIATLSPNLALTFADFWII